MWENTATMEEQFMASPEYYVRFTDEHGEVWRCVGRLTDNQADIVREEFVSEFGEENILLRSLEELHEQWQEEKVRAIEESTDYPRHASEDEKQSHIIGILLDDPAEKTEMRFKLSLEKQSLTTKQCEALNECLDIANRVRATSGLGTPQSADTTHQALISSTDKPVRVYIENIAPVAQKQLRQATYEAELALKYADKTDEWHHISEAKYGGKGWAAIATAKLEQEVQDGKRNKFSKSDIESLARTVQNKVEAHRKRLGIGENGTGE
jgi:hypothetical protein